MANDPGAQFERASQIFEHALRLPEADRAAFVQNACGNDTALLKLINDLLAAQARQGSFLGDRTTQVAPLVPLVRESLLAPDSRMAASSPGAAIPSGESSVTRSASDSMLLPITEKPGSIIGRYKLLQQIGEGGFGVVFLAEQREPVQRKVALKIIKLGMDTRAFIARFEAERQALALMDHPHIARVLDGGVTGAAQNVAQTSGLWGPVVHTSGLPGHVVQTSGLTEQSGASHYAYAGRPYFVMEYVLGDPITDFADHHKLGVRDRLDLFTQVCQAVQHAHQKGVIHRDIKPRNVLVSMVDGRPHAKVIDFGIAKATGARLTDKTLFTEHRQLIGTPEYMSPEQAEGSPDIDTRTDVYALGVLLYELLTGVTPFDARRLRSAAFAEMQRIIREEEPPAPSLRILKPPLVVQTSPFATVERVSNPSIVGQVSNMPEVRPESEPRPPGRGHTPDPTSHLAAARQSDPAKLGTLIKGDLDWIVMKALDKDRGRRYETANAFAQDVQRHLAGEPVVAAPPSAGYRIRKFVRKHRAGVLTASLVAATLILGMTATSFAMLRAQNAEAAGRQLRDRLRLANAELIMRQLEPDAYSEPSPLPSIDDLREACAARKELLGPSARATLEVLFTLARQLDAGEGLQTYRELIERAERSTDLPRVRFIDMLQLAASYHESELDFSYARKANAKIVDLLESCERDNTLLKERPAYKFWTSVQGWSWEFSMTSDRDAPDLDPIRSDQYQLNLKELREAILHYRGRASADLSAIVARELALESIGRGRQGLPGSLERCQDFVRRARQADPSSRTCAVAHALALFREGRFQDSLAQCDKANTMPGDELLGSVLELATRCLALSNLGRSDDARVALDQLRQRLIAPTDFEIDVLIKGISGMEVGYLVEGAESLIDPQPTPEQKLAEETKQRRLFQATAIIRTVEAVYDPGRMEQTGRYRETSEIECEELRKAFATRMEYLGRGHPDVADAAFVLLTYCGPDSQLDYDDFAQLASYYEEPCSVREDREYQFIERTAFLAIRSGRFEEAAHWYQVLGARLLEQDPIDWTGPWSEFCYSLFKQELVEHGKDAVYWDNELFANALLAVTPDHIREFTEANGAGSTWRTFPWGT